MNLSRLAAAAALTAVAVIAPATSAQAREWHPIEGHADLVLATCSDGSQVLSAMPSEPRRNRYSMDFVTGDQTSTGGRWTVNLAGEGWVIKDAGRITYDAASGEMDFSGLVSADWAALCPFFGVPA